MPVIGELIVKMEAESAAFTRGMEQNRRTVDRTHQSVLNFANGSSRGFRKIESSVAMLGLEMVGLHGKTGRLAEGLLMLGAGGGVALAVTAGLAIVGFAYDKLTEGTRKAREETDKFVEAQKGLLTQGRSPLSTYISNVKLQFDAIAKLNTEFGQIEQRQRISGAPSGTLTSRQKDIVSELAVLHDRLVQLHGDWKAMEQDAVWDAQWAAAEKYRKALEAILAKQHEWRVANAGGGNLTAGMGGSNAGPLIGGLLSGATADEITNSRAADAMDRQARAAAQFREAWTSAIQGTQSAFLEFFDTIGQSGTTLLSLLEGIAKAIKHTLAELASQQIVNSIFGGVLGHISGPTGSTVGNVTQSGGGAGLSASTVHVHQTIHFNAGFVDGASGEAWLRSKSGTIAGVVADAAGQAPAFARFIVAQGSR